MKIKYEFDTESEKFDRGELLRVQKADDAVKALWDLQEAVLEWYRGHTNRPCNPDTLHTVFYQILNDAGINLDELWA